MVVLALLADRWRPSLWLSLVDLDLHTGRIGERYSEMFVSSVEQMSKLCNDGVQWEEPEFSLQAEL